jgi:hypothetical protein
MGLGSCSNFSVPNPFATLVKQVTVEWICYTSTPTLPPTETSTPTITPTETPTLTETPRPSADEIYYKDAVVLRPEFSPDIGGVKMNFSLIINDTLFSRQFSPVKSLVPNEKFKNSKGEAWDQAIAHFISDYMYKGWIKQHDSAMSRTEWNKMLSAYQTGAEYNDTIPTFDDVAIEVHVDDFSSTAPNRNRVVKITPDQLEVTYVNGAMNHLQKVDLKEIESYGFAEKDGVLRLITGVPVGDYGHGVALIGHTLQAIELAFFPEKIDKIKLIDYLPVGWEDILLVDYRGWAIPPIKTENDGYLDQ